MSYFRYSGHKFQLFDADILGAYSNGQNIKFDAYLWNGNLRVSLTVDSDLWLRVA